MILSTLLRPPGTLPENKTPGVPVPERLTLRGTRARRRRYERAVYVGIILSVVVHVIAVRLSGVLIRFVEPGRFQIPTRAVEYRPRGMQALDVRVVEAVPVEAAQPVREPPPERVELEPAPAVELGPTVSAAERLRPRIGDWRLWVVSPVPRRTDRSVAERAAEVEARLYARLEAANDSIAAELARQAGQTDWTVGEEGNKWGISPGKIHLGPVTLPLPFFIEPDRATREALEEYDAIRRQAGQGEVDETIQERIKAIRERKAREEAEKKAKPDSTSAR